MIGDRESEKLLNAVAARIKALKPPDVEQRVVLQSAQQQFLRLVELRWIIVGPSEGTIAAIGAIAVARHISNTSSKYSLERYRDSTRTHCRLLCPARCLKRS